MAKFGKHPRLHFPLEEPVCLADTLKLLQLKKKKKRKHLLKLNIIFPIYLTMKNTIKEYPLLYLFTLGKNCSN